MSDAFDEQDIVEGGVSIAECETEREARLLAFMLLNAGIQSGVLVPEGKFDLHLPQLRVVPEDVERASAILSVPISSALREEFDTPVEDFRIPSCPKCGSGEALLDSVGDENRWLCGECNHAWSG